MPLPAGVAFITTDNEILTSKDVGFLVRLTTNIHSIVDVDSRLGVRIPATRVHTSNGRAVWIRAVVDFSIPKDTLSAFIKCASPLSHLQSLAMSIQRTIANHYDDTTLLQESNEQLAAAVFTRLESMAKEFGIALIDYRLVDLVAEPVETDLIVSEQEARLQYERERVERDHIEVEAIREMLLQPHGREALQIVLARRDRKSVV